MLRPPCLRREPGAKTLLLVLALCSGISAACYTTTIELASGRESQKLLDDLHLSALAREAAVSRDEIEGRLGAPASTFEGGRIATYAVRKVRGRFEVVPIGAASGPGADYRLVLVFGPDDTVERWSVVDRDH